MSAIRFTRLHPAIGNDRKKVVHVFSERGYEFTALATFRDRRLKVGSVVEEEELVQLRDAARIWERGASVRMAERRARSAAKAGDRPTEGTVSGVMPGMRGRVMVYLDGEFALALSAETAEGAGIVPGAVLTADEVARLKRGQESSNVGERIDRLASYRPRTAAEVRGRLVKAGYDAELVDVEIAKRVAEDFGVLTDDSFVEWFASARGMRKGKDFGMLVGELRHLGVSAEAIEKGRTAYAGEGRDEALVIAEKKAAHGLDLTSEPGRRKFVERLARKGFRYADAKAALDRRGQEDQDLAEADDLEAETS